MSVKPSNAAADISVKTGAEKSDGWADVSVLGELVASLVIFCMSPMLLGIVSGEGMIGLIPWMLPAFCIYFFIIIIQFRKGNMIRGTASTLLIVIALFQNLIKALIHLFYSGRELTLPDTVANGIKWIDSLAFLTLALIFFCIIYIEYHKSKIDAFFLLLPGLGFVMFGFSELGLLHLQAVAGWMMICFGLWKLYEGLRALLKAAANT